MPDVYVDESHNTGENLLDPNQPVFTLAGVHLDEATAADLVAQVRLRAKIPDTQKESKFSSLARSRCGRRALRWAFSQLPQGSVRSFLVHKRFMVVTKMADLLVEPSAYVSGFNLYEGKQALALANMLHTCGPVFGSQDAYDRLLQAFVDWGRRQATTDDLFASLGSFKDTVTHTEFIGGVALLELGRGVADEHAVALASGDVNDSLDPAVPSLYCLCVDFGKVLGPFRLVHDTSKVISRNAELLSMVEHLPEPANPEQFMEPLSTTKIDFADSKDYPQMQLADWAAGALRRWATQRALDNQDPFAEALTSVVEPWLIDGIWPYGTEPLPT